MTFILKFLKLSLTFILNLKILKFMVCIDRFSDLYFRTTYDDRVRMSRFQRKWMKKRRRGKARRQAL